MQLLTGFLSSGSAVLLILAVAVIGVLHTMVPDHWAPITVIARQRGWNKTQVARAAATAGLGHVATTLVLGLVVWVAGVAFAARFGGIVDAVSSIALIAFGAWVGISAWLEERHDHAHEEREDGTQKRTALLLILGSSPMVEGIPAFFAASKLGIGVIIVMSLVFGLSTILTYVVLCTTFHAGLEKVEVPAFEKYGEVISGFVIMALGVVFLLFPIL